MKFFKYITIVIIALFLIIIFISIHQIYLKNPYNIAISNYKLGIDKELASSFGEFFGGYIGTLLSFLSVILLIYTILEQNIEKKKEALKTNFFKMIDYHNQNVSQLIIPDIKNVSNKSENRRVFVQYKLQIHELLKILKEILQEKEENRIIIADISYVIFYYGIDIENINSEWFNFTKKKLEKIYLSEKNILRIVDSIKNRKLKLWRTNQTNLSVYFKNMYNAIKIVDEENLFSRYEKQELINIYKSQISTPELYVILFHFISRFGTTAPYEKWKKYQDTYGIFSQEDLDNDFFDGYVIDDCFKNIICK